MSMYQIDHFEKDKYYVMTPPGEHWYQYEGPWDTQDEALAYLGCFINDDNSFSPEMLRMAVVFFDGNQVGLAKTESGTILNGEYLYWNLGKSLPEPPQPEVDCDDLMRED